MLTNSQKQLIKQAQRAAGVGDAEYRNLIASVALLPNCRSSTDRRLGNEFFDRFMGLLEAVYWRGVDSGTAAPGSRVFAARGYWARKNTRGETSRDRYATRSLESEIATEEARMRARGHGDAYLGEIRKRTGEGWPYLAALRRDLKHERVGA